MESSWPLVFFTFRRRERKYLRAQQG